MTINTAATLSPVTPVAAPKRRAPKETIERIMEAARNEFGNAGLSGARIEEIAIRAGVTKQLVYHYYQNKTELYIAVLDEAASRTAAELIKIEYDELDPTAAVRLFFQSVFDQYERWPYLAGLRLGENMHRYEHIMARKRSALKISVLITKFSAIIERGQRAGLFRLDIDPRMVFGAGLILITGCFTNGMTLSSLLPVDLMAPEGIAFWREYSVQFVLNSMCIHGTNMPAATH
ncbi:MAG: TetR family transcriptional regulator [Verrucomicrobiaceae bacterium]|nr:TetR family transcriptional regulator [Verrucomicrobiaceae bacterium]